MKTRRCKVGEAHGRDIQTIETHTLSLSILPSRRGLARVVLLTKRPRLNLQSTQETMSSSDEDLFADSGGDTDDLIAESKKDAKPIARPKKLTKKKIKKKGTPKKRKRSDIPGTFFFKI